MNATREFIHFVLYVFALIFAVDFFAMGLQRRITVARA